MLGLVGVLSTECAWPPRAHVGRVVDAVLRGNDDGLTRPGLGAAAAAATAGVAERDGRAGRRLRQSSAAAVADRAPRRRAGDGGALIIMIVLGVLGRFRKSATPTRFWGSSARGTASSSAARGCARGDVAEALFFVDDGDFDPPPHEFVS